MNTTILFKSPASKRNQPTRGIRINERGASILIILALLACMMLMLAANSTALAWLKQELKVIDGQQQQKYGQGPHH
jgi:hypothetical protein